MSVMNIERTAATLAIVMAFAVAGCTEKLAAPPKVKAPTAKAAENDPRAKVIGVEPGAPAKDTPSTTSTAKTDISKAQESKAMPLPGQANDHSTLSPMPSQKAAPTGR